MLKSRVTVMAALIIALGGGVFAAENWTRFRGPNGTGVSEATNLPVEFGPESHVKWKAVVPPGHSSPVFTDTHIFLTAHSPEREDYKLFVLALDRKTGKQLWQHEIPRRQTGRREQVNGPASPSPVTDGSNVYFFFQDFGLISYTADGKERWRVPLGPFNMFYGFGASPILEDGIVILPVDQDTDPYLLAIDAKTGKQRWRVSRPHVISGYSTPTIWRPKDGPAQILIPESFQLTAYSLADGKQLWWVRGLACEMKSVASIDNDTLYVNGWGFGQNQAGTQIPTVDFATGLKRFDADGDGMISIDEVKKPSTEKMDRMLQPGVGFEAFDGNRDGKLDAREWEVFRAMLAAENGLMAIKLGGSGDMTASALKWKYLRPVPQVPSTVLYRGVLYMVNDSGILISFDPATGNVIKQGRLKGAIDKYFASPIGADGKVWLVSQDGTVTVVSAKGEWEVLQVNAMDDEVFATPVPSDGELFIRTRSALYNFAAGR
ncbi:MAG: PQQ-binding-like beta-propeller repeat protein [Acidobacteriota bacterium]